MISLSLPLHLPDSQWGDYADANWGAVTVHMLEQVCY